MGDAPDRTEPEAAEQNGPPWLRWINLRSTTIEGLTREQLTTLLSPQEKISLEQFHRAQDRDRLLVGRAVLRMILGRMLKCEPSSLMMTTNQCGKPSLDSSYCPHPPAFNLSHSGDLILIGIHDNNQVGVDIEHIRPIPEREELANEYLDWHQVELLRQTAKGQKDGYFLQQWCRLESQLKATGKGFAANLDTADTKQNGTHTWDLPLPQGYCGATSIVLS